MPAPQKLAPGPRGQRQADDDVDPRGRRLVVDDEMELPPLKPRKRRVTLREHQEKQDELMESRGIKATGTRLEVYLGQARRTPGGLTADDLQDPIIKSVKASTAARLKTKAEIPNRICAWGEKNPVVAKSRAKQASRQQDARTITPHNKPGRKELVPLRAKRPVKRPKRYQSEQLEDIAENDPALYQQITEGAGWH